MYNRVFSTQATQLRFPYGAFMNTYGLSQKDSTSIIHNWNYLKIIFPPNRLGLDYHIRHRLFCNYPISFTHKISIYVLN